MPTDPNTPDPKDPNDPANIDLGTGAPIKLGDTVKDPEPKTLDGSVPVVPSPADKGVAPTEEQLQKARVAAAQQQAARDRSVAAGREPPAYRPPASLQGPTLDNRTQAELVLGNDTGPDADVIKVKGIPSAKPNDLLAPGKQDARVQAALAREAQEEAARKATADAAAKRAAEEARAAEARAALPPSPVTSIDPYAEPDVPVAKAAPAIPPLEPSLDASGRRTRDSMVGDLDKDGAISFSPPIDKLPTFAQIRQYAKDAGVGVEAAAARMNLSEDDMRLVIANEEHRLKNQAVLDKIPAAPKSKGEFKYDGNAEVPPPPKRGFWDRVLRRKPKADKSLNRALGVVQEGLGLDKDTPVTLPLTKEQIVKLHKSGVDNEQEKQLKEMWAREDSLADLNRMKGLLAPGSATNPPVTSLPDVDLGNNIPDVPPANLSGVNSAAAIAASGILTPASDPVIDVNAPGTPGVNSQSAIAASGILTPASDPVIDLEDDGIPGLPTARPAADAAAPAAAGVTQYPTGQNNKPMFTGEEPLFDEPATDAAPKRAFGWGRDAAKAADTPAAEVVTPADWMSEPGDPVVTSEADELKRKYGNNAVAQQLNVERTTLDPAKPVHEVPIDDTDPITAQLLGDDQSSDLHGRSGVPDAVPAEDDKIPMAYAVPDEEPHNPADSIFHEPEGHEHDKDGSSVNLANPGVGRTVDSSTDLMDSLPGSSVLAAAAVVDAAAGKRKKKDEPTEEVLLDVPPEEVIELGDAHDAPPVPVAPKSAAKAVPAKPASDRAPTRESQIARRAMDPVGEVLRAAKGNYRKRGTDEALDIVWDVSGSGATETVRLFIPAGDFGEKRSHSSNVATSLAEIVNASGQLQLFAPKDKTPDPQKPSSYVAVLPGYYRINIAAGAEGPGTAMDDLKKRLTEELGEYRRKTKTPPPLPAKAAEEPAKPAPVVHEIPPEVVHELPPEEPKSVPRAKPLWKDILPVVDAETRARLIEERGKDPVAEILTIATAKPIEAKDDIDWQTTKGTIDGKPVMLVRLNVPKGSMKANVADENGHVSKVTVATKVAMESLAEIINASDSLSTVKTKVRFDGRDKEGNPAKLRNKESADVVDAGDHWTMVVRGTGKDGAKTMEELKAALKEQVPDRRETWTAGVSGRAL